MSHHHDIREQIEPSQEQFREKAIKLLKHWIQHNSEHARSYQKWADEFRSHDLVEAAAELETAAEFTQRINAAFNQAAGDIQSKGK